MSSLLRQACRDLDRRLRGGEAVHAEEFLVAMPELEAETEAALELIYTEFVVREELGQCPLPDEWFARFPQWRQDREQLFEDHQYVDQAAKDSDSTACETLVSQGDSAPDGLSPIPNGRRLGGYELIEEIGRAHV